MVENIYLCVVLKMYFEGGIMYILEVGNLMLLYKIGDKMIKEKFEKKKLVVHILVILLVFMCGWQIVTSNKLERTQYELQE